MRSYYYQIFLVWDPLPSGFQEHFRLPNRVCPVKGLIVSWVLLNLLVLGDKRVEVPVFWPNCMGKRLLFKIDVWIIWWIYSFAIKIKYIIHIVYQSCYRYICIYNGFVYHLLSLYLLCFIAFIGSWCLF